jgi:hypothetical protein
MLNTGIFSKYFEDRKVEAEIFWQPVSGTEAVAEENNLLAHQHGSELPGTGTDT